MKISQDLQTRLMPTRIHIRQQEKLKVIVGIKAWCDLYMSEKSKYAKNAVRMRSVQ